MRVISGTQKRRVESKVEEKEERDSRGDREVVENKVGTFAYFQTNIVVYCLCCPKTKSNSANLVHFNF